MLKKSNRVIRPEDYRKFLMKKREATLRQHAQHGYSYVRYYSSRFPNRTGKQEQARYTRQRQQREAKLAAYRASLNH